MFGYSLGARITDKLMLEKSRCHVQKDIFKFVCRELWQLFFQKQADRLQTNKKGGYIIFEEASPWLKRLLPYEGMDSGKVPLINVKCGNDAATLLSEKEKKRTASFGNSADAQAALICGIIRGALTILGCPCLVSYDLENPPSCSFHALVIS
ncbi:transport particle component Bet3 domain protein [Gregarina niphandrodes]|uniref:Transport particle component Bet3 domain protein n=1 Tax=Gregarina niphandrodes TaxID=110365 RepID=A0A023B2L3_GRENI|nr:transport particle component Bet3 domain protein [Gregarina niphandrodes]EZG55084.1 transport particle component Bet3 domain protein [Gregarina niphandrodes]|eukprot:XP_011131787.1 transport particle component Bet3 domain protein [Gregarina niphandrodes]